MSFRFHDFFQIKTLLERVWILLFESWVLLLGLIINILRLVWGECSWLFKSFLGG